eukprot:8035898-Alexandrium_andersonii.AAC.1
MFELMTGAQVEAARALQRSEVQAVVSIKETLHAFKVEFRRLLSRTVHRGDAERFVFKPAS